MALTFNITEYTVTIEGEPLRLLRKEYLLLEYLYQHNNRALSRQQILDAVWSLQIPSDRTIDDHIYRLRKKLKKWEHLIKIETVKGFGYKLIGTTKTTCLLPFVNDEEIQELSRNLLSKYHLYGQGEVIQKLLDNNTFGIKLDATRQHVIDFLSGNFLPLLQAQHIPFKEKAHLLLGLYGLMEENCDNVYKILQSLEEKQVFGETEQEDLNLFRILIALKANKFPKAHTLLLESENKISPEIVSFYGFYQLWWLTYALCVKDFTLVLEKNNILEEFFKKHPFQREYGLFLLLKGFYCFHLNEKTHGLDLITQSFNVLERTKFAIQTLITLCIAEKLLTHYYNEKAEEIIFLKKEEVYEKYRLNEIKDKLKGKFARFL
jgi:DNA-binding winged helix-turn-helix (wHTH) protein